MLILVIFCMIGNIFDNIFKVGKLMCIVLVFMVILMIFVLVMNIFVLVLNIFCVVMCQLCVVMCMWVGKIWGVNICNENINSDNMCNYCGFFN